VRHGATIEAETSMITTLRAHGCERIYDDEVGRFVEGSAIPCHRCGVCCERWQAMVDGGEIARIADVLGVTASEMRDTATEPYPFDDGVRLLRHQGGGCIFLRRDPDGASRCAVHAVRPAVCRDWVASLDRRECIDGLARFQGDGDIVLLSAVYPAEQDRIRFGRTIRAGTIRDAG